ncbi:MAG: AAA family ATPase [Myxococcales bacterium]|nr:AAA family ATPase [Myxococcales bacterium]
MTTHPLDADLLDGTTLPLDAIGNHRKAAHVFERESLLAVRAALGCGRPLLVRGEPGVGKSQLARAVAHKLGRVFLSKFIDARTEAHELLWSYDAVTRLAEAQAWAHGKGKASAALASADERTSGDAAPDATARADGDAAPNAGAAGGGAAETADPAIVLARKNYVEPGPLWWAFDWKGAEAHATGSALKGQPPPYDPCVVDPANGAVVLIDEIDKADGSVPNGLLECLGQGMFSVPGLDAPVCVEGPQPLVLLTSNDDRMLPDAFLRRCLVLWLRVPEARADFEKARTADPLVQWLVKRGRAHFDEELSDDTYVDAAVQVVKDRRNVPANHRCAPGLAEYIDLLAALDADRRRTVGELSRFFLHKHADPGPPR